MNKITRHAGSKRRRFLGLEQLEGRALLAGNVTASITGGNLVISGDSAANEITITRSGANSVTITGTGTTVNGGTSAVTLNGFRKHVTVSMNDGDDVVRFVRSSTDLFRIFGNLIVDTGNGNDTVSFSDTSVWGALSITTGAGDDSVSSTPGASTWGLRVAKTSFVSTGSGEDSVSWSRSQLRMTQSVNLGADNDELIIANSAYWKQTNFNGGGGVDSFLTSGSSFAKRRTLTSLETRGAAPSNSLPVAVADSATVAEGATASINLATNDTDSDGTIDLTSIVITQNPANGSVTVNNNGTVSYTHNGTNTTTDSFQYTIKDNSGATSNVATVSITVTPVNDAPVAVADSATVAEGATASINLATNDTDSDGTIDLTSIVITQNPANGSVTVNNNGTVSYTHNGTNTTTDSFQYTIKDNSGATSNVATVSITVTPVNDAPIAVADSATVAEGATASINLATNDTDSDGTIDLTSIVITQNPANGSVTVNNNGTVSYTHNGSNTTTDSFQYTIKDNSGATSNVATVSITVTPVNDAPIAVADSATVAEGATASINLATNDTDSDGTIDLTSIVITQNPANGSVTVNNNGTVSYTHNGSNTTTDSFQYTIKDNNGATSNVATVSITITAVNDAPVAVADSSTVAEGGTISINLATNDTDSDGTIDLTSIMITQNPANGSITVNNDGTVSYTHNGSNTTSDSFQYTIEDNTGAVSNVATVSITVTPVNDAPVAVADNSTVAEGGTISINLATNDTDSDGTIDLTSIVITQNPANGSVTVNNNGTVSYTHNGSNTTTDSFQYTIKDNLGSTSNVTTVSITITPVNDAPIAAADSATVAEGGTILIDLADNDTDSDGTLDLTSIVITQNPANGSVTVNNDGAVSYTHNGSNTTTDSFQYTIEDNTGAVSNIATVSITVTPVNDAPVAVADSATVAEGGSIAIDLADNDTDSDGTIDLTSIVITQNPANGSVIVNNDGTVSYTHNGSETTTDSFQYTIADNTGAVSNAASVNITITPVNDPPVATGELFDVTEDSGTPATGNVLTNDTDPEGTTLTVASVGGLPSNVSQNVPGLYGIFHIQTDGTFTYTLDDTNATVNNLDDLEELIDQISYDVTDGLLTSSATAQVKIFGNTD
jgi:VCBS repeat-containing protein